MPPPLRICIVTREYPPVTPYSGGIGRQYEALAPRLAALGHDVHVVTVGHGGPRELDGVTAHPLPRSNPFVRSPATARLAGAWLAEHASWARAVARAVERLGPFDAVYAPEWGGEASAYAGRKRAGALVTNLQMSLEQMLAISPGLELSRVAVRRRLQMLLERRQAERSDGIAGCSSAVLAWARELWRLDAIPAAVLPNVVDVARVRALARGPRPAGLPDGGPIVAFSGRLEPRKGVFVLARAMRRVWERVPDARLVLIGGEQWTPGASERVRREAGGHGDRIHFLGHQEPDALFPALMAADVVALPSLWEAFGIAALEAMALGRAVVVTKGSGYDDFCTDGETASMVAPGDDSALAGAIAELLAGDGLRARLGTGAAETAEAYDVQQTAPRHAAFLEQVAAGAARA